MDPDLAGHLPQFGESAPAPTLPADYMPGLNTTATPDLANSTEGLNMTGDATDPQFYDYEDLEGVTIPTPMDSNIFLQRPQQRWCLPSDLGNINTLTIILEYSLSI